MEFSNRVIPLGDTMAARRVAGPNPDRGATVLTTGPHNVIIHVLLSHWDITPTPKAFLSVQLTKQIGANARQTDKPLDF